MITTTLTEDNKAKLQERLLEWFERNARDFPWRSQSSPYTVLVAEKLLQQTAAKDKLVEVYGRFIATYPSPKILAQADVSELEDIIQPLGLRYRAKELYSMANELVKRYNGIVPRDMGKLVELPGIGEYTARAVLSFAFGEDIPVVDVNVARFLYRIFGLTGPLPSNPERKRDLMELALKLKPEGQSKKFNLAILDLCAQVCKPRRPRCLECPIQMHCTYYQER